MLEIKLIKSTIGKPEKQKRIAKGLGLTKLNKTVYRKKTIENLGMVRKINHLLQIKDLTNEAS